MMVAGHGLVGDTERMALMDRLGAFVRVQSFNRGGRCRLWGEQ